MTRRLHAWLLVFCLLGLGAALASAYVHYRILRDPTYTSFCDVSETISCQAVYESRFGTVRGVPVALGGVIWFTWALLLTLAARPARLGNGTISDGGFKANVPSYLFVLSTVALAVVLYLAYASFVLLKAVCILCVATYIAVIGLFLLTGTASEVAMRSLPGRAIRDARLLLTRPMALLVSLLFLAGSATAVAFFPREGQAAAATPAAAVPTGGTQQSEFERYFTSQPRTPIAVASDGARVVIVKFNDYQCPACGQTYLNYRSILAKYRAEHPGAVKFITMDYPLEPECNPAVPRVVHESACEGAAAVRLAREHHRDEAMEEWLYAHQQTLTPAAVKTAAREVGEVTDFDARYPRVLQAIRSDIEMAQRLGVSRTPTFYINGVKVEGGLQPQYFDAAIDYEIKHAAASTDRP